MSTFNKILVSIPIEFKQSTAFEFSRLFSPAYQYGSADAHFFYPDNQNKFEAYLVAKWIAANETRSLYPENKDTIFSNKLNKLEGTIMVRYINPLDNELITSKFTNAIATLLHKSEWISDKNSITTLVQIKEPMDETTASCDAYTELSKRVSMLEDSILHLTNATEKAVSRSITFGT